MVLTQRLACRSVLTPFLRMAKKKEVKGAVREKAPSVFEHKAERDKAIAEGRLFGINYSKKGEDPKVLADEEYPDWLWKLLEPKKSLPELEREMTAADGDIGKLDMADVRRYYDLSRRVKIKANNEARKKG